MKWPKVNLLNFQKTYIQIHNTRSDTKQTTPKDKISHSAISVLFRAAEIQFEVETFFNPRVEFYYFLTSHLRRSRLSSSSHPRTVLYLIFYYFSCAVIWFRRWPLWTRFPLPSCASLTTVPRAKVFVAFRRRGWARAVSEFDIRFRSCRISLQLLSRRNINPVVYFWAQSFSYSGKVRGKP